MLETDFSQNWKTVKSHFTLEKLLTAFRSTENRGVVFKYDDSYLASSDAKSISISLPLKNDEFTQKQCMPFFSGLIPEEYTRKRVSDYLHISELSTIKLLAALGQECAGYITIADKDVYIVQRYDRIETDGKILRLHQEDMCQALGIITD